jgi:organic radical activating enzyme
LWAGGVSSSLETNMTLFPDCINQLTWITGSPKSLNFNTNLMPYVNEVKILAGIPYWKDLARVVAGLARPSTLLYIMPLADGDGPIEGYTQEAIKYCLNNPRFNLCVQLHKIIGVR